MTDTCQAFKLKAGEATTLTVWILMRPVLEALREGGGRAGAAEVAESVKQGLGLEGDIKGLLDDESTGAGAQLEARAGLTLRYLEGAGLLTYSEERWRISESAPELADLEKVKAEIRRRGWKVTSGVAVARGVEMRTAANGSQGKEGWRIRLRDLLTKGVTPGAFERLIRQVLEASGFLEVEVTGRCCDGGIDGRGVLRMHDFVSLRVVFQCKRYEGTVGAKHARDFRGAMAGRADRGLLVTTGKFSAEAVKEARRDGASQIDLVDGEQLADKLKALGIGVKTRMVEEVTLDERFFEGEFFKFYDG